VAVRTHISDVLGMRAPSVVSDMRDSACTEIECCHGQSQEC